MGSQAVRTLALTLALALGSPLAAGAESLEARSKPRPGRHKALGLAIGTIVGNVVGIATAIHACNGEGCGYLTIGGLGVGGALLGYAAGGGFATDAEAALERGRARVRLARREGLEELGRRLRLADRPGLEPSAWEPQPHPEARLALLR